MKLIWKEWCEKMIELCQSARYRRRIHHHHYNIFRELPGHEGKSPVLANWMLYAAFDYGSGIQKLSGKSRVQSEKIDATTYEKHKSRSVIIYFFLFVSLRMFTY